MIKNAILAAALTATVAQPAAAGNNDIFNLFAGIIVGAAIADMNNKAQHNNHQYYDAQREHVAPRVCYQEVERRGNFVTVYGLDCNGNIITAETRRRNH